MTQNLLNVGPGLHSWIPRVQARNLFGTFPGKFAGAFGRRVPFCSDNLRNSSGTFACTINNRTRVRLLIVMPDDY